MATAAKTVAVVVALAIAAVLAYGVLVLAQEQDALSDAQREANCIAVAEASTPVVVAPSDSDGGFYTGDLIAGEEFDDLVDDRHEAVDECEAED